MAKGNAFWMRGDAGLFLSVKECHVKTIISNPEMFGTTLKDIKSVYKKFKEPVGTEGNAREQIMLKAMQKGWIRGREYYGGGDERLSIELWALTEFAQRSLMAFAEKSIAGEVPVMLKGKYVPVTVTEFWSKDGDAEVVETDQSPMGKLKIKTYKIEMIDMATSGVIDETLVPLDNMQVIYESGFTPAIVKSIMEKISKVELRESCESRTKAIRKILD